MQNLQDRQLTKFEARLKLVKTMQTGSDWQSAAQAAGLTTSRSAAYRFLKAFHDCGDQALFEGRHGHPSKLKAEIQTWLVDYCQANPSVTSPQLQAQLHAQFDLTVSISRLNVVRARLGITRLNSTPTSKTSKKKVTLTVELDEPDQPPQPHWQEGAGSLILLAAAEQTGLLEGLQQALPLQTAPATSRLAHQRQTTTRQLVQTLLFMPVAQQYKTWDLRCYTGGQLALLTNRNQAYGYRSTERFLSEVAQAGGSETLTDGLAQWTYHLWYNQFHPHPCAETQAHPEEGRPQLPIPTFYVDGHHKAVYSDKLIPRGLVGKLGKVLGCRGLVLLHDEQGHPLLAITGRGDQHLTVGLPQVVERFERATAGTFSIRRVIADREVMSGEFLAREQQAQRVVVTLLKENQYKDEASFEQVGDFVPWLYDRKGRLAREVAPASFSLEITSPLTDQPLRLEVALIRDLRRQKAANSSEAKLIPIVTTSLEAEEPGLNQSEALELASAYRARWPLQENIFKDWLLEVGLDVNHGYTKHPVENSEVSKRKAYLQQRIATAQKRLASSKERGKKATKQYKQRREKLQASRRQGGAELDQLYEGLLSEASSHHLSYEQKMKYEKAKNRAQEEWEELEERMWQSYSVSNREYDKQREYERLEQELNKDLEKLQQNERQMEELDNSKDQVMTVFKIALVNLGMWVRDHCFPKKYEHCTWKRLLSFFDLGGWVQEGMEEVRVELNNFNDSRLNRDLQEVCELVNQAGLRLPDGRQLKVAMKVEPKAVSKIAETEAALREHGPPPAPIPLYTGISKAG